MMEIGIICGSTHRVLNEWLVAVMHWDPAKSPCIPQEKILEKNNNSQKTTLKVHLLFPHKSYLRIHGFSLIRMCFVGLGGPQQTTYTWHFSSPVRQTRSSELHPFWCVAPSGKRLQFTWLITWHGTLRFFTIELTISITILNSYLSPVTRGS